MQEFLEHCCKGRHYFFSIKKCGESTCTICRPLRCLPEDFEQLHYLPDPVPGEDLHYKSFDELYGITSRNNPIRPIFKLPKVDRKLVKYLLIISKKIGKFGIAEFYIPPATCQKFDI